MQRGFGGSKQLLIGTAWLSLEELHHHWLLLMVPVPRCSSLPPLTAGGPGWCLLKHRAPLWCFLTPVHQLFILRPPSAPSSSKNAHFFVFSASSMIFNQAPLRLTLTFEPANLRRVWPRLSKALQRLYYAFSCFFFPLTRSPFHLVLTMHGLSARKCIIIHLRALIVIPLGVSYVSAVCTL